VITAQDFVRGSQNGPCGYDDEKRCETHRVALYVPSLFCCDCPREQCPREGFSLETRNPDSNASRSPVVGRAVLTRAAMCPVLPSLVLTKVFVHLPGEFCLSTAARVNREWRVCAKLSVMQVHLKSLPGASLCSLQARQPHFGLHHEASVS
jgi:hypothetical protein